MKELHFMRKVQLRVGVFPTAKRWARACVRVMKSTMMRHEVCTFSRTRNQTFI